MSSADSIGQECKARGPVVGEFRIAPQAGNRKLLFDGPYAFGNYIVAEWLGFHRFPQKQDGWSYDAPFSRIGVTTTMARASSCGEPPFSGLACTFTCMMHIPESSVCT